MGRGPGAWLRSMALAADEAGFAGLAVMDHLIQIPQVDRAWEPIPEPWVTLGLVAGLDTRLRLGTLVTPVTFRPARHHREGRGHPRRADRRPCLRRRRRRVVGPRARGVRPPVPAGPRTARRPRGRHRDDAGAVGRGHQGLRRRARQSARDDVVPPPRRPDPGHRRAAAASAGRWPSPRGWATAATCPRTSSASTASWRSCAGTWTPSVARTTTSRSPSSTCRSWVATETTSGRGSSGTAAARPPRRTPRRSTRARWPSSGNGTPPSPTAASARCSCRRPTSTAPTTCWPWPG